MLQAGERDLVFLVREVEADAAGNQQRAADEPEDQQEITAKKPPTLNPRDFGVLFLDGLDGLQRALPPPTLSPGTGGDADFGRANLRDEAENLTGALGPVLAVVPEAGLADRRGLDRRLDTDRGVRAYERDGDSREHGEGRQQQRHAPPGL